MHVPFKKNKAVELVKSYSIYGSTFSNMNNGEADQLVEETIQTARRRGHMTPDDIQVVAQWTSRRRMDRLGENSPDMVADETAKAFADKTGDEARINALMRLAGIGWARASVILHFAFPNRYATMTQPVIRTIKGPESYCYESWNEITKFCQKTRKQYGMTMRDFDRALWTYFEACGSKV